MAVINHSLIQAQPATYPPTTAICYLHPGWPATVISLMVPLPLLMTPTPVMLMQIGPRCFKLNPSKLLPICSTYSFLSILGRGCASGAIYEMFSLMWVRWVPIWAAPSSGRFGTHVSFLGRPFKWQQSEITTASGDTLVSGIRQ